MNATSNAALQGSARQAFNVIGDRRKALVAIEQDPMPGASR